MALLVNIATNGYTYLKDNLMGYYDIAVYTTGNLLSGCMGSVYELGRWTPMLHTSQIQFLCPYISVQIGAMSKPMWV